VPPSAKYSIIPPVFTQVRVDFAVAGGSKVYWELGCNFNEPLPYFFQLQVAHQGLSDYQRDGTGRSDDWENIGGQLVNAFSAYDNRERAFGKTADVHYRVKLTTAAGNVYYSDPVSVLNGLDKRDWNIVREMIRKERLRFRKQVGQEAYLLKAIRYGPQCPACVDPITGEVTNSQCQTCYGTGFAGGYFPPFNTYVAIEPEQTREALNPQTNMSAPVAVPGRVLAEPQVYSLDVFVMKHSDKRYYVHPVSVAAQVRGIPVVLQVELRLAPFSDVVYSVPVPHP
jgi:hypothetical protein